MGAKYSEASYYRLNFLKRTIFPVFFYPILISFLCLHFMPTCQNVPIILKPFFYIFTIVLHNFVRVQSFEFFQRREATRLGAQLVPRVKGKWIGNLDLILKKDPKIPYLGQRMEDMFNERGSRTINFRVLWVDNVSHPSELQNP